MFAGLFNKMLLCIPVACLIIGAAGCGGGSGAQAGEPQITLDVVPALGGFENLQGRVLNVEPRDYAIAVYIYVGGWWNKPYWDSPLTAINKEGEWSCDITTGGYDQNATKIAVFLVPKGYSPLILGGQAQIPSEVTEGAIASMEVIRASGGIDRIILFSGYEWTVKKSDIPVGPPDAGNYFSDSADNVWVDSQGRLHMKIARRDGKWWCSEIVCREQLGYGTYRFVLDSDVASLNEQVVLGLFTWDDSPEHAHRKMDIEFSRWGQKSDPNAQYVVQPWNQDGHRYRFSVSPIVGSSRHSFTWHSDRVDFDSAQGETTLTSWAFTGPGVPPPGNENARINLWLVGGYSVPPSDGRQVEVIVSKFEHLP